MTESRRSVKIYLSQLERVFPKQDTTAKEKKFFAKAIRTAGSNAENRLRLATSVALLIELEAQFYKLVTINQCHAAKTCEMVNKSSKSVIFAIQTLIHCDWTPSKTAREGALCVAVSC